MEEYNKDLIKETFGFVLFCGVYYHLENLISALKKNENFDNEITIFSDSKNTVNQLNHEFAINNEQLRSLAREAWSLIAKFSNLKLRWVPRSENLAGKMLGS